MKFATRTIHAGQPSEPETGALVAPIFQTSTYEQEAPGHNKGFSYSRTNNPTASGSKPCWQSWKESNTARPLPRELRPKTQFSRRICVRAMKSSFLRTFTAALITVLNKVFQPIGVVTKQIDTGDLKAVEAALADRQRALVDRDSHEPASADQ